MIEQWELARNMLDAKKAVDSLWYISRHYADLFNVRDLCNSKRSDYYINVCAVLDKSVCKNGKKKEFVNSDSIIARVYNERDKHYAHKDKNYHPSFPWSSLEAESLSYQSELNHLLIVCKDYLPDDLTLDFVCYDGELFRRIEKISPKDEEAIKMRKYPLYKHPIFKDIETYEFKALCDIDDLKNMTDAEKSEYGVVIDNGLTFEEGLQLRQDACVKINVLFDENIWCHPNKDSWDECQKLQQNGFFDKFGCINSFRIMQEIMKGSKKNMKITQAQETNTDHTKKYKDDGDDKEIHR